MTKYNYNYDTFYNEDDVSYYLLGAYMTDGCVQINGKSSWITTISSKDENWLQLIREYICPDIKIRQGNQVKLFSISNKEIGGWFISNGCVPRKSAILECPDVPSKYLPDFLRGCWDGDGSISFYTKKSNNKIIYSSYLCSASFLFLEKISAILIENGINNSICETSKQNCKINGRIVVAKHNQYRITLGGRATYKLVKLLYYPNHKLSLPRKKERANTIINYYQTLEKEKELLLT
jgi:hypothetical protein